MTLQSSGAISINDLVGEYGGSTPHALNEYYRGGSLVDNHSNNGNVPTSGTIDLQDFYGANNDSPDDLVCVIAVGQSGIKHGSEGFRTSHASDNFGSASDSTLNIGGTSYTVTTIMSNNNILGGYDSELVTSPGMTSSTLSSYSTMTLSSSGKSGGGSLSWSGSYWQWAHATNSFFDDHGVGTTTTCTIS